METLISIFTNNQFYFSVLRSATPVLLTTLGAIIASRSGASNIALEGTMLSSAFSGVIVSAFTKNVWLGLLGAVLMGFIMSNILAYFALKLKSNIIITGIALNLMASGATVFALYIIAGDKGASTSLQSLTLPSIEIPIINKIPIIGSVLSGHHILTYIGLILVVVIWAMFKYTSLGLHIRAVGELPESAESVGISVNKIKYIALSLSGILAGLGGAFLSMGYLSRFSAGMTSGRGYIALATQAMAAGNTFIGLATSLIFGFCDSLSIYLQGKSLPIEFVQLMPYLTIVILYTIYSAVNSRKNKI